MGIKRCFRQHCDSVMCDRYSEKHGYICFSCFEELVDSGPATNIANFMATPSSNNEENSHEQAKARFDIAFPRDDE